MSSLNLLPSISPTGIKTSRSASKNENDNNNKTNNGKRESTLKDTILIRNSYIVIEIADLLKQVQMIMLV